MQFANYAQLTFHPKEFNLRDFWTIVHSAILGEREREQLGDHNEGYFSRRKIFCQLGATKLQKSRKKHVQQGGKES